MTDHAAHPLYTHMHMQTAKQNFTLSTSKSQNVLTEQYQQMVPQACFKVSMHDQHIQMAHFQVRSFI